MAQMNNGYYYATGRRKSASARVFIKAGTGKATINGRDIEEFFGKDTLWIQQAVQALKLLRQESAFDIKATVSGGGITGQAGAFSHGLARALDYFAVKNGSKTELADKIAQISDASEDGDDSADDTALSLEKWHTCLRKAGLLTRDARKVERKKVGLVKARKAKQFSKR